MFKVWSPAEVKAEMKFAACGVERLSNSLGKSTGPSAAVCSHGGVLFSSLF